MKSISELTDFYYKKLYPTLQELEKKRKKLRYRIVIVATLYTVFFLFVSSFFLLHTINLELLSFIFIAYLAGGTLLYKFLLKDYTSQFKEKIIVPLIQEFDSKLLYSANLHIPKEHFIRSKLFTQRPNKMNGNDYVRGTIDGIKIEFSDLHAQKESRDRNGKSNNITIFQGLFIVSDFNKQFHGETIVLPDTAQRTFGDYIGNFLQSNNLNRDELVKMDSVTFEKEFVVYSNDQIEARYILSHSLMQKLLNYKKKTKKSLYISFVNNKIYLAIAYNKDLFEPSIFHSLLEYKIAMEYVGTLHLAIGIVEELKLNQKLWSKL